MYSAGLILYMADSRNSPKVHLCQVIRSHTINKQSEVPFERSPPDRTPFTTTAVDSVSELFKTSLPLTQKTLLEIFENELRVY